MIRYRAAVLLLLICLCGDVFADDENLEGESVSVGAMGDGAAVGANGGLGALEPVGSELGARQRSEANQAVAAEELAPITQSTGTTYGEAQNPNNSAVDPNTTAAVNNATTENLELNAAVDELQAENKLLKEDALALKTMLALGMMSASEAAAGSGSGNASSQTPSSAFTNSPSITTNGIEVSAASTPSIVTTTIPNSPADSPVPQEESIIVGPVVPPSSLNTANYAAGNLAGVAPAVMMAPSNEPMDYFSRPNNRVTMEESTPDRKVIVARGLASASRSSAAAAAVNSESELLEDPRLRAALKTAAARAGQKAEAEKKNAPKLDQKLAKSLADFSDVKVNPDVHTAVVKSPFDRLGEKLVETFGNSLWPDLKGKPWSGGSRLKRVLGFGDSYPPPASGAISPETIPWFLFLFLLGVGLSTMVFLVPAVRRFAIKRIPHFARLLPTQTEFLALVMDANDYQTQIIAEKAVGSGTSWQIGLRHKTSGEFVVVGVPKEDAVFPAQCLSPKLQNDLQIQHGLERVRFVGKRGFERTSEDLNPAFRPFPDKIGFLQQSGLLRGGKKAA